MPASRVAIRRRRAWPRVRRWLYVVHRWIGIASCLLFAIWFVSGLVMIYVPFPSLSADERLAGLPPIDWSRVAVRPDAAAAAAGVADTPSLTLEMEAARPVWRVLDWSGRETTVSAETGDVQWAMGARGAAAIAAAFGHRRVIGIERIERDQWTVAGGFDRHRPLWKAALDASGGRELYVSSRSGAVVLDTNARERFWNWIGSVPHWIYPTVLRQDNAVWRQVVMWVSGPCILGAITGLWIGLLRVRLGQRRFKGGRVIPYRGWMAWHHIAGLIGGGALLMWIFSGWLSVDPFRVFASPSVSLAAKQAYAGTDPLPRLDPAQLAAIAPDARQVTIERAAGRIVMTLAGPGDRPIALDAATLAPLRLGEPAIVAAARRLLPGAPLRSVERLTRPDAYWYEVGVEPVLPMLRLRFADSAASWLHIDPATGRLEGKLDRRRRVYRWAFDFLHKWDANGLTLRRPLWDVWVWLLSAVGLVTSLSGVWIGWRRLTRRSV